MPDVERRLGDVVELTRALIRAPSPSPPGDERAVVEVVSDYLDDVPGVELRILAADPLRPNLVCTAGSGPTLGLFAHTDTVPVGDDGWSVDPFGGALRDGRVYGRGATDNKGAVAAMAVAFRTLVESDPRPEGRLLFCANADEEQGGRYGIAHVAEALAHELDAAVVAEPSGIDDSFERLWVASRGVCAFRILVEGTQGHSSLADHHEALNAVGRLFELWPHLRERFRELIPDGVVLNPVRLLGGVDYGIVPGQSAVWCECRVAPGNERGQVQARLERAADEAIRASGIPAKLVFEPAPYGWIAPSSVAVDQPIVRAARSAWASTLGAEPRLGTFPGGTDGWVLAQHGVPTLPGVGPGALMRAHGADEHVTVADLETATRLYVALATAYFADYGERP